MKRWIPILSGLLGAQVVLALAVNLTGEDYGAYQATEKLLAFDKESVDGLRIEDAENSVVLKSRNGKWLLPEREDFPVSGGDVERLLNKLSSLEKGWPVATTSGAARRFKVSEEEFERKLTLLSKNETLAELYVGTSPGFRKVHVRPGDKDAVFGVGFNAWEANAEADDWIDKEILRLDESEIAAVEMPGFVLRREEGTLKVQGLTEEEQTNEEEARAFVGKLAGLRIQSLLGTEAKPEYRQDDPELELKIKREGGDVLAYRFSKPEEGAHYVLKRSDLEHYFKVPEFTVDPIKETARTKLVRTEADRRSAEAPEAEQSAAAPETAE